MADQSTPLAIQDNPTLHRYEAIVEGQHALVAYRLQGQTITFTHTEVPAALEGQGIGSQLARFVLEDARARGLTVVAQCPFIAAFIQRHPEYQDLDL